MSSIFRLGQRIGHAHDLPDSDCPSDSNTLKFHVM
jgi:hypothetical protein